MPSKLEQDLAKLDELAFDRRGYSEDDFRRFHALRLKKGPKIVAQIDRLRRWMLTPITLWPFNIHDVFCVCLDSLEAKQPLDEEMLVLIQQLPEPPPENTCKVVMEHEHLVQYGNYDSLITTQAKFDSIEKEQMRNPDLIHEWEEIKTKWDVSKFSNTNGMIRRTVSGERNLRTSFKVDWEKPAQRFQAVFDSFCSRWNLYGMQGDRPLTMKLTVNLTPHGTMIFIPAYWSFDAKRDMRWNAVKRIHGVRALKKQGPGLADGIEKRRADAAKLQELDAKAKQMKLKGGAKHVFLCKGLGFVEDTDPNRLTRLRKECGNT